MPPTLCPANRPRWTRRGGECNSARTSAAKRGCRTVTVEREDKPALSADAGSEAAKRAYKYVHQHLGIPLGAYATSVVATLDFCWDSTKVLDGAATDPAGVPRPARHLSSGGRVSDTRSRRYSKKPSRSAATTSTPWSSTS